MNNTTKKRGDSFIIGKTSDGLLSIDVELRADKDGRVELSISGSAGKYAFGQVIDHIAGARDVPGWNDERRERVRALWARWHLNAMRSMCEHQRASGWDAIAREKIIVRTWKLNSATWSRRREIERRVLEDASRHPAAHTAASEREILNLPLEVKTYGRRENPNRDHYEPSRFTHEDEKTLGWIRPSEHPRGILTAPCPTCGYGYGTAWLYEPLDDAAKHEIRELFDIDVDALARVAQRRAKTS